MDSLGVERAFVAWARLNLDVVDYVRAEARTLQDRSFFANYESLPLESDEEQPQVLRLAALAQDDSGSM